MTIFQFAESVGIWFRDQIPMIISIIVTYIAYQQYKSNRYKIKLDLYEKRLKIYNKFNAFITLCSFHSSNLKMDNILNFTIEAGESVFLFDKEVENSFTSIRDNAVNLTDTQLDIKKKEIVNWFQLELDNLENRFKKYIDLKKAF